LEVSNETLGSSHVALATLAESAWGNYPNHVLNKYCQLYGINVDYSVGNDHFDFTFDVSVSDDGMCQAPDTKRSDWHRAGATRSDY
jgi:hypothetical protein